MGHLSFSATLLINKFVFVRGILIDWAVLAKWLSHILLQLQTQPTRLSILGDLRLGNSNEKYIHIQNTHHSVLEHWRKNRLHPFVIGWPLSEENPSTERERDTERFGYCRRESGVLLARYAVWASRVVESFYSSSLACLITKLCRLSRSRPPWCSSPCSPALKMIKVG